MTKNEITLKVRQRIDEVGISEVISLGFPIDPFINESANQALLDAPIQLSDNIVDFKESSITSSSDGTGSVELPTGFVKLIEFKMSGWSHSVFEPTLNTPTLQAKQTNLVTRANPYRPIVTIDSDKLNYFSIEVGSTPKIEVAKAQIYKTTFTSYPDILADAISWLAASKVLQVMNEKTLSDSALVQYAQILSQLKREK